VFVQIVAHKSQVNEMCAQSVTHKSQVNKGVCPASDAQITGEQNVSGQ
jgi:hypothetical protein